MKYLFSLFFLAILVGCGSSSSLPQPTEAENFPTAHYEQQRYNQHCYWQQEADYDMDIRLNVNTNQFTGEQTMVYTNNSPDTLSKVFYHLYFNAFQPGSMMDVRSRTIRDADSRVADRISKLKESEIGYQKVQRMTMNGKPVQTKVMGTILEVQLPEAMAPNTTHTFEMEWEGQVPLQIRRSGRDSKEGVRYSMTQWYPKIAEYDQMGWHAYEYVGREFHSPWGDYDVRITLDGNYMVGGSGVLQSDGTTYSNFEKGNGEKTWHFEVQNVIDFAWAADPDYTHKAVQVPGGPLVHYLYQPNGSNKVAWEKLISEYTVPLFTTMSEEFGQYPYPVYSVIQGGDGGMEYPLATLITGNREFESLYGVTSHELAHSWFQMMLATNEALYAWMDEGMTSFADAVVTKKVFNEEGNPFEGSYRGYKSLVESGFNEPANLHSDHFNTNYAYSIAAYVKGALFLSQLRYIMGEEVFENAMRRYYYEWRFKHPTPNDFVRVMEKESGLQLHWFLREWMNTTETIDYAVGSVSQSTTEAVTTVELRNESTIPMPVEVTIEFNDGRPTEVAYIPMNELLGSKDISGWENWSEKPVWNWVEPSYELMILAPKSAIASITIDEGNQTADINRENNIWAQ